MSWGTWGWKLFLQGCGGVRALGVTLTELLGLWRISETDGINPLSVFASCGNVRSDMEGYLASMATLFAGNLCGRNDGMNNSRSVGNTVQFSIANESFHFRLGFANSPISRWVVFFCLIHISARVHFPSQSRFDSSAFHSGSCAMS